MIQLFRKYDVEIKTSVYSHMLHDERVTWFEDAFKEYVGGKYAVGVSSATNAIYLLAKYLKPYKPSIPSVLPPVVANALLQASEYNSFTLVDNVDWVGKRYTLWETGDIRVIDSAQEVIPGLLGAEKNYAYVYSFYPTKPLGGCDGGMIVTDNKDLYNWLRLAVMNGTTQSTNSWSREVQFAGWKMYMNSIQADILYQRLQGLDEELKVIRKIRQAYNSRFDLQNTSSHLYLLSVNNGDEAREWMHDQGITCGKHYTPLHLIPTYSSHKDIPLPLSEAHNIHTISIPLHSDLTEEEIAKVMDETAAMLSDMTTIKNLFKTLDPAL